MNTNIPLAERLRPTSLDELVGQQHLTGKGSILRTAIDSGRIPSMILWGPPGVGKTTIANIIAHTLQVPFYQLSAISKKSAFLATELLNCWEAILLPVMLQLSCSCLRIVSFFVDIGLCACKSKPDHTQDHGIHID